MIKQFKRRIRALSFLSIFLFVFGGLFELYEYNNSNVYAYLSGLIPSLLLCCMIILLLHYVEQLLEEREKLKKELEERNSQLYTLSYQEYKERKVEIAHHIYDEEIATALLQDSHDPLLRPAGLILFHAERLSHDQTEHIFAMMNERMIFAKMNKHVYLLISYRTTAKQIDHMSELFNKIGITSKAAFITDNRSLYDVYEAMRKEE